MEKAILKLSSLLVVLFSCSDKKVSDPRIIDYIANPLSEDIAFYWKNDSNKIISSIQNLKTDIESKGKNLVFATNGGMFKKGNIPQGLYIENFKEIQPLDTLSGEGNFYMKPNGVFYITAQNKSVICQTKDFEKNNQIKYATQSGPMLVINGKIHPKFKEGSTNLNIRNGVGILPNGKIVFAMSKEEINFYDFAHYFQSLGCENALYLDGYVSRTYLPEKDWVQMDGNFGVIIGITK